MARLSSLAAVNAHLDQRKLTITSGQDAEQQKAAERVIKGRLFGIVDASLMATWDLDATPTPIAPPSLIQEISALFVASDIYSAKVSEDQPNVTPYGQILYNRGMSLLEGVATGHYKLYDLDPSIVPFTENDLQTTDFWPNDDTANLCAADDKKFRMRMKF